MTDIVDNDGVNTLWQRYQLGMSVGYWWPRHSMLIALTSLTYTHTTVQSHNLYAYNDHQVLSQSRIKEKDSKHLQNTICYNSVLHMSTDSNLTMHSSACSSA